MPTINLEKGVNVMRSRAYRTHIATVIAVVILFGLITSCSDTSSETQALPGGSSIQDLAGTNWSLSLLRGDGLLLISIITAEFDQEGMVSGIASCNGYSATYLIEGDHFSMAGLETTDSSCRQRLMDQETRYLETLESIVSYEVLGTTLEMRDGEGRAMLVYDTLRQTTLRGSSWTLTDYDDGTGTVVPLLPETRVTADFGDDGLLSGSAGCNGYSASYDVANKLVNIEALVMTEIFCMDPEGVMDQEMAYLSALDKSEAYTIVGEAMGLLDKEGAIQVIYSSEKE